MAVIQSPGHRAGTPLPNSKRPSLVSRALALTALWLAGAGAAQSQTQWVVDASGGGDFTNLQAAIDQAAAGDVLRILPGNYGAAQIAKSLSLIGNADLPKPVVASLDIQSAPTFSLQHLHVHTLRVVGGEGRSVIDFCQIGPGNPLLPAGFSQIPRLAVQAAPDLVLSSSEVIGALSSNWADGFLAMDVSDGSLVHILQSSVRAQDTSYADGYGPGYGDDALRVRSNSTVWLTASNVRGGGGQDGPLWAPGDGKTGRAVRLQTGGRLYARGRSDHRIQGGLDCAYQSWNCSFSTAVSCDPSTSALAFHSGVTFSGFSCSQYVGYEEPFLMGIGLGQPGSNKRLWFYGEAGTPAVLLISAAPAAFSIPQIQGTPLWLDPAQLLLALPGVTTGFTLPVIQTFPLPATGALAGLQIYLQGVQIPAAGLWRATNLVNFSLGW